MAEINILNVTEYIVRNRPEKKISKIKLQVAIYLIQEAFVREKGKPLFRESFIKKESFPECTMLRGIECAAAGTVALEDVSEFRRNLSAGTRDIIDRVMKELDLKTALELKMIIASDPAWKETEPGRPITVKRMEG